MEKVKVTKKKADAIENAMKILEDVGMTVGNLLDTLELGYEVIPEYKKGDWCYNTVNNLCCQITKMNGVEVWGDWYGDGSKTWSFKDSIRHATEEEIAQEKEERWWNKHGRDVGEYRENDIVSHDDNTWGGIYIVYSNTYGHDAFRNRLIRVCNRHMHKGKKLSFQANELKVICFASDRKDVKE